MFRRDKTRKVKIGNLYIGGGEPIAVQSMTNTDSHDVEATVSQIKRLEDEGCEIVRISVPDVETAKNIGRIKTKIKIPLVADIHFDWRIALISAKEGADKLRINPGNIGSSQKVKEVVRAAKQAKIPIRIGVNSGSLRSVHSGNLYRNYIKERAEKLVESALENLRVLEENDFFDTVVSLKASDVPTTVEAYKLFAAKRNYPLHVGITEAGSAVRGAIKSAVGMGILFYEGLGDTLRVSLTADPVMEVRTAYQLLQSLGLRSAGIDIVSCPTCSRCEVDLIKIVDEFESEISKIPHSFFASRKKPLKVAIMGCVVNGPGEAKESDFGIAGGKKTGLLFENGKIIRKVAPKNWVKTLVELVRKKAINKI